jgi:hypothetical protein
MERAHHFAYQTDIILCYLKNQEYSDWVFNNLSQILEWFIKYRTILKYKDFLAFLSKFIYFLVALKSTDLKIKREFGSENVSKEKLNLGEEYCGIYRVNSNQMSSISFRTKILAFILSSFFPFLLKIIYKKLSPYLLNIYHSNQQLITNNPSEGDILSKNHKKLTFLKLLFLNFFPVLDFEKFIEFTSRINKSLFLIYGDYYEISTRILKIIHVYLPPVSKAKQNFQIQFKRIGQIMMLQILITISLCLFKIGRLSFKTLRLYFQIKKRALFKKKQILNSEDEKVNPQLINSQEENLILQKECSLCYNQMKYLSATSCGHIFCWECIIQALENKNECPICRKPTLPQQVVLLQNFQMIN